MTSNTALYSFEPSAIVAWSLLWSASYLYDKFLSSISFGGVTCESAYSHSLNGKLINCSMICSQPSGVIMCGNIVMKSLLRSISNSSPEYLSTTTSDMSLPFIESIDKTSSMFGSSAPSNFDCANPPTLIGIMSPLWMIESYLRKSPVF